MTQLTRTLAALTMLCGLPTGGLFAQQVDTLLARGGIQDLGGFVAHATRDAAISPSGTVVIAQNDGLYAVLPDGQVLKFAAEGDGPGDVRYVDHLSFGPGDRLLRVWDKSLRRVTAFASESFSVEGTYRVAAGAVPGQEGFVAGGGVVLVATAKEYPDPFGRVQAGDRVSVDSLVFEVRDEGQGLLGTFTEEDAAIPEIVTGGNGAPRLRTRHRVPGVPRLSFDVAAGRLVLVRGDAATIRLIDLGSMASDSIIAPAGPRVPIDRQAFRELVDRYIGDGSGQSFELGGVTVGGGGRDERRARAVSMVPAPEYRPYWDRVVLDEDATVVWLRRWSADADADQRWIGGGGDSGTSSFALPADVHLAAVRGTQLVGWSRDELDILTVLVLERRK